MNRFFAARPRIVSMRFGTRAPANVHRRRSRVFRSVCLLTLLLVAAPVMTVEIGCAEDCEEQASGPCAPVCTLCASCALPALSSHSPRASTGKEPGVMLSRPGVPGLLAGLSPGILHVPRPAAS